MQNLLETPSVPRPKALTSEVIDGAQMASSASVCAFTSDASRRVDIEVDADDSIGAGTGAHADADAGALMQTLDQLLQMLRASHYRFITPTPATHQRVLYNRAQCDVAAEGADLAVPGPAGHADSGALLSLRDIFGWSLPFEPAALEAHAPLWAPLLEQPCVSSRCGALRRSLVRVSSIGADLFLHSAYPTSQDDAVFFGPDTYRFARFIAAGLGRCGAVAGASTRPFRILDIGCGSGAGGIVAARAAAAGMASSTVARAIEVTMNDINPAALRFTEINARAAGIDVLLALGDATSAVTGKFDLIVSNPPYMQDARQRAYRHGGAGLGRALSVRIAAEALQRLAPGGALLLYTGVAMVDHRDPFLDELRPLLDDAAFAWTYEELDADIFGEELEQPQYGHVERIAAVGLIATRLAKAD